MNLHKPTERVISILSIISKNPNTLTLSNISKLINIPKSTLSPILKTLVELEILIFNPNSQKYNIGLTSFQIGQTYLNNLNGLTLIKDHMRTIVNECNETCQLGINHNDKVLYITKIESSHPIKLMSSIGSNLPLYCTGLGRALLWKYSNTEIEKLYSKNLIKFTENTISDRDTLIKIIYDSKKKGYCEEIGEITSDAQCVAVPIILNKNIVAALGISLPIFRASDEHLDKIKALLKEHAICISRELESLNISTII